MSSLRKLSTSRGKATVKDVARAAGVSVTTVSRVLNNVPGVSAQTAAHVMAAMKALNYDPAQLRRLRRNGSATAGWPSARRKSASWR